MTDAINSGGETWTEYTVSADSAYVTEYHAYYNSDARLAKIIFRTSSHISSYNYILSGLLHGTSDYNSYVSYIPSYGSGSTVSRKVIVDVAGAFYSTDNTFQASGPNYVEFIYPYYS